MMRIEELIYGAWVCRADDARHMPLRIEGLEYNGTLHLRDIAGDRVEVSLRDVAPVVINSDMLQRFGFVPTKGNNVWMRQIGDIRLTVALKSRHGEEYSRRCAISGKIACWNEEIRAVHELQRWWNDKVYFPFDIPLEMKWHERR